MFNKMSLVLNSIIVANAMIGNDFYCNEMSSKRFNVSLTIDDLSRVIDEKTKLLNRNTSELYFYIPRKLTGNFLLHRLRYENDPVDGNPKVSYIVLDVYSNLGIDGLNKLIKLINNYIKYMEDFYSKRGGVATSVEIIQTSDRPHYDIDDLERYPVRFNYEEWYTRIALSSIIKAIENHSFSVKNLYLTKISYLKYAFNK